MKNKILKYSVYNVMRSRIVLGYAALLFLLGNGFVYLQQDADKTVLSLLTVMLMIVPLVSIIFGTIQFYNAREFTELVMAQPVKRSSIFYAQYFGVAGVMGLAVLVGLGIPLLTTGLTAAATYLLVCSILLTFVFVALAMAASVFTSDKAKGIGAALILWFYFAVLHDAGILSTLIYFDEYPMEKPVLLLTALNPIDLSRIVTMMNLDASALMGFTGAVFDKVLGSSAGIFAAFGLMGLWIAVPVLLAARKFSKKDF